MVGPGECLGAKRAFEGPLAGVEAHVTGQFVGPFELLVARSPRTRVRRLSGVSAHVCRQMRSLRVDLSGVAI